MARIYYSLLVAEDGGPWTIQFGDYVRSVVVQEQKDTYDEMYPDAAGASFKIICTNDHQSAIEAAVKELNKEPW